MKMICDVPNEVIKSVRMGTWCGSSVTEKMVAKGTPVPDDATVGEVFRILTGREPICDTANYFTIDKDLWDSPYKSENMEINNEFWRKCGK